MLTIHYFLRTKNCYCVFNYYFFQTTLIEGGTHLFALQSHVSVDAQANELQQHCCVEGVTHSGYCDPQHV